MNHPLLPVLSFLSVITPGIISPCSAFASSVTEKRVEATDSISANDSTAVSLSEIVVEGRAQRVIKFGVEYTPAKNIKKVSSDAIALLRKMQIPQLDIAPASKEVKNITGQEVTMFIDYVKATAQDLSGMRPEDVLRVEVLEYPDDPRFQSASFVVNFIMKKYEWGGYTKLSAGGQLLNAEAVDGEVYSKFVYKKWTYDANASAVWNHLDRSFTNSEEILRQVPFGDREYPEIIRKATAGSDHLEKLNNQWAFFRASYNSDKKYLQHWISFSRQATPLSRDGSSVTFVPQLFSSSAASTNSDNLSLYPSLGGYYYFQLPKSNTVTLNWSFTYVSTRRHSSYQLADLDPIINDNKEKTFMPTISAQYTKKFARENTFRTSLFTYSNIYHTRYAGSYNGLQKLLSSETMLFLEYMKNWSKGISLYSRIGGSMTIGRVNGSTTLRQFNPRLGVQLQYKINDKHSASIDGWWGNSHPNPSTTSTALVQSNEILWIQGNPDLRNTLFASSSLRYNFIPNNHFSLAASLEYEGNPNKQAYEYYTLPGLDGLVRRSINSGDAHVYSAGLNLSYKLLDNALMFRVGGQASRTVLTGVDAITKSLLIGSANAQYGRDNWSVSLNYYSPSRYIGAWSNAHYYESPSYYSIDADYAVGNFKASVSFANWFRREGVTTDFFSSPRFSQTTSSYSIGRSRYLSLNLSYTFSYGKEVNRNENVQRANAGSGILK